MIYLAIPTMSQERLDDALEEAAPGVCLVWLNGVAYNTALSSSQELVIAGSQTNIGVTPALHALWQLAERECRLKSDDWILFIHDDTLIQENAWEEKVEGWLEAAPKAGLFGFGGALGLGDPDLYQKPYQLTQLARRDFVSNMTAAELHGRRVTKPTRVATLDGFALGVKVEVLRKLNGFAWWPNDLPHHSYDNALACEVARAGYEIWMLPISVNHLGGQTATKVDFMQDFGKSESEIHAQGHVWLYERYRDVLPLKIGG